MSAAAAAIDARSWPVHPSPHLAVRCIYTQQSATSQSQLARVVLKSWHISLKNTICCSSLISRFMQKFCCASRSSTSSCRLFISPTSTYTMNIIKRPSLVVRREKCQQREMICRPSSDATSCTLFSTRSHYHLHTHIGSVCAAREKQRLKTRKLPAFKLTLLLLICCSA